jgi:hypothetical protein
MIVQAQFKDVIDVALAMREDDRREVMATRWTDCPYAFAADCMRLPGSRIAAIHESGNAVAVGGVALNQPGVGQAWLIGTDAIGAYGVEIAHAARKVIATLFSAGELHRIQAYSAAFHTRAHRWLKAIGLREEARLPAYGKDGEDFLIFSVVKGA